MNKLTKLLSVFIIAGAVGTGVAGIAGCKTPTNEHKHEYETTYTSYGESGHAHKATCHPDEHDELKQHTFDDDQDTTCNDCDYTRTVTAPGELFEVAADVRALIVEGYGDADVQLSSSKTSHTIDKSAIKVYFATGSSSNPVKGAEVLAANFELELREPSLAPASSWTDLKSDGDYKIVAKLKNCKLAEGAPAGLTVEMITSTITVTVHNAIVSNSLAVKVSDSVKTTQVQSSKNEILPTWTFEVTRENGDKEDVPAAEVTVSGLDTTKVNAAGVATLTWGNVTGTQSYTITKDETKVEQSYALNFAELTAEEKTKLKTEDVSIQNGRFVVQATSGEVADHRGSAPEYDGKYLAGRLKLGGKYDGDNAKRYVKITTDGEATITVYGFANSGTAGNGASGRYLSLYENVTFGPKASDASKTVATATGLIGTKQETLQKENSKHEFSVAEAGTYWLLCEGGDVCITYIQIDQLVTKGDGVAERPLPAGETKLAKLSVKSKTADYKQSFTVGQTFSVSDEYSYNGVYYNTVTCAKVKEEAITTGLTYWLGGTQLVPGTTVLSADLFAALGDQKITVKVDGETETAEYTVSVESAVPGVTGITASVKDTVNTEVSSADAKITLAKTDIEAALVGSNANATIQINTVKYRLKSAAAGSETEITESAELGVGEYVIVVVATVTDSGANKSAEFETTCELRIAVAGAIQDIKYTISADDVTAVDSSNSTAENTLLDDGNGKIVVGTNCKGGANSVTVDGTAYSNRIQLGGTYKPADGSKNAIVLEVKEACTIKVIYNTSSNGTARTLSVWNSAGEKAVAGEAVDGAKMVSYEITTAGTYYLGSEGSGINIWYIEIDYTSNNV